MTEIYATRIEWLRGRLVALLAKDAGMSPDDPLLLESLARLRKEQPEQWDDLVRLLTPGAKA
ncbi:hypothetical protein [Methanoculleus sp.]|uniref:hypothetical protein n=1 Tax=Methanoculleus sp. TaxID=90427 RepID=UPI00272DEA14|nr:hypothetical protein [Methanoculleus sp.]